MKQFFHIIRESLNGNTNDPSTIRIQSYLVLAPILLCVLIFLIIEIWSFIHAIKHGNAYRLSNEIIVVFGMTLSHHLAVLFQRTKSQSILDIKGGGTPTTDTPIDPTKQING
jgi:hypothetical protein